MRKSLLAVGVALTACLTVAAAGIAVAACSSSSSPAAGPDAAPLPVAKCTDGGLTVAFSPMHSAFDGKHTFQVPAVVRGSNGQVTWSADATMVGMQTDPERPNEVLITMLKAGAVIINVQSDDGKCGSSLLTITQAAESDWEIGSARYNNGKSLHLAGMTGPQGTGSPLEEGTGGPACTSCHGETATNGPFTNVSHTPEQTGGFSDEDILNIVLHGTFPDGGTFDPTIVTYPAWMNFHRWSDITEDQQKGIIVYLRSLPPVRQKGSINFGAFDMDSGDMDATVGDETPVVEAGPVVDATPDAPPPVPEAGPVPDAAPVDAGNPVDTGTPAGSGSPVDAVVPADAGGDANLDSGT